MPAGASEDFFILLK